jgi:hypothetical protein
MSDLFLLVVAITGFLTALLGCAALCWLYVVVVCEYFQESPAAEWLKNNVLDESIGEYTVKGLIRKCL